MSELKRRILAVLLIVLVFCLLCIALSSCVASNHSGGGESSSEEEETSNDIVSEAPETYSDWELKRMHELLWENLSKERENFNIKLELFGYTDTDKLKIRVTDYNNLGFYIDHEYILEKRDGNTWIEYVNLREKKKDGISDLLGRKNILYPSLKKEYASAVIQIWQCPRLEQGEYRITMYIHDRPFTCEFEIN